MIHYHLSTWRVFYSHFIFHGQMIKIWVSSLSFSISLCPSYPGSIKRSKVFTSELLQRHHLRDDQAPVTEPHCNEGKTLCRRRECSLKKIAQLCFKCTHCTVPVLCKPTKRISRSALTQKIHSVILVGVVDLESKWNTRILCRRNQTRPNGLNRSASWIPDPSSERQGRTEWGWGGWGGLRLS